MFLTRSEYDRGVNTFSPEGRLFQVSRKSKSKPRLASLSMESTSSDKETDFEYACQDNMGVDSRPVLLNQVENSIRAKDGSLRQNVVGTAYTTQG